MVLLLFLGISIAWLATDPEVRRDSFGAGSSRDTGANGMSLARRWLEGSGRHVELLMAPLSRARLAPDTVLFRLETPLAAATGARRAVRVSAGTGNADAGTTGADREADDQGSGNELPTRRLLLSEADEVFVAGGGRLVTVTSVTSSKGSLVKVLPILPEVRLLESSPTGKGIPDPPQVLADMPPDAVAVFERDGQPAIARLQSGRGDVWLIAEPRFLWNGELPRADNLALLAALAPVGRPVAFDEWTHGAREDSGIVALMRRWGLGPALLLLVLAASAAAWHAAVPVGPPDAPPPERRSEAVDLVDSLAVLYRSVLSPLEALQTYRDRLLREIELRKHVGPARAAKLLAEYAPGLDLNPRRNPSRAEFRRQLAILVRGFERLHDDHPRP